MMSLTVWLPGPMFFLGCGERACVTKGVWCGEWLGRGVTQLQLVAATAAVSMHPTGMHSCSAV